MTENSDFKHIVRARAAKTGESYQTARRSLERNRGPQFSALATSTFDRRVGRVLGCVMEAGTVTCGMRVTVKASDGIAHEGVVVSLRHMWDDLESVAHGEVRNFGLLVEPTYLGPIPAQVTG